MPLPRISIIVPVYNEEKTLPTLMDRLVKTCGDFAEIVYVDDGSKDASFRILQERARERDTVLHKENGGKGSAVRYGLTKVTSPLTMIQDADLEYDPSQIPAFLEHAEKHSGHIVFGSRFLQPNPNRYKRHLLGNKMLTAIANLLFCLKRPERNRTTGKLTDAYTCYKLFPTDVLRSFPLRANGFEIEAELTGYPLKRGIPVDELPIRYEPRSIEDGKKIRFVDAWKGLKTFLSIRFHQP